MDSELRAILRAEMLEFGLAPAMIDETLDLAKHAAICAIQTLEGICQTASRELVRENALAIGLALAALKLDQANKELAAQYRMLGEGFHVVTVGVSRTPAGRGVLQ